MQRGSISRSSRKEGPDVWQFRWSERGVYGERIYRKRVIGTVAEYSDDDAAHRAVAGLLREINLDDSRKGDKKRAHRGSHHDLTMIGTPVFSDRTEFSVSTTEEYSVEISRVSDLSFAFTMRFRAEV